MSVINDYLRDVAEPQKSVLAHISKLIIRIIPDATEAISYGMPGFKYKGKYLITFAAFKDHLSVFPGAHAVEILKNELSEFKLSKGTIQFTVEKPISDVLIEKIVLVRVDDINAGSKD
jgi:uncharacterized protein YdhG (YjbR/CyaY superfamily)